MADDNAMELSDMASTSMAAIMAEEPAAANETSNEETLLPPKPLVSLDSPYADDGAGSGFGSSADVTSSRDALVAETPVYTPPMTTSESAPSAEKDAAAAASTEYWTAEEKETPLTGMASSIALFTGATEDMSSHDRAAAAKRMLTTWQLIGLSVPWIAYNIYWFIVLIVAIPTQVIAIADPKGKGYAVLVIFLVGGFVSLFASVIFGYLADRIYTHPKMGGRRFSFIFISGVLMVPLSICIAGADSLAYLTATLAVVNILSTMFTVPYNGLVADVVQRDQRGRASAIQGAFSAIGYVLGAVLGLFYSTLGNYITYTIISVLLLLSIIVAYVSVREEPFTRADLARILKADRDLRESKMRKGPNRVVNFFRSIYAGILLPLFDPLLTNRDFFWVFLTRFFMELGQYTVQEFLQYWLADCLAAVELFGTTLSSSTEVSLVLLPMLIAATVAALVSGYVSDHWGKRRRFFIVLGSICMIVACIALIFIRNIWIGVAIGVLFGIGYGCYLSSNFAACLDCLPSQDDAARDVALWHLAYVLPQIFATPLAGALLDTFQVIGDDEGIDCLGYTVIWALAALYFLLGAIFIGPYFVSKIR